MLLKGHDAGGFVFYTNRTSRKGSDLAEVPRACLLFPWHAIQRQVIIEGTVTALSAERERAVLPLPAARLPARRLGQQAVHGDRAPGPSWTSATPSWSSAGRSGTQVPMPEFWGGYRVYPDMMEFWQGRVNRLHDRLRYRRDGGRWVIERLAP